MAGLVLVLLLFTWFFWHTHSFHDFADMLRHLLPAYTGTEHNSIFHLLRAMLDRGFLVVFLLAAAITLLLRADWTNWERWALAFGVLFGAASFLVQQKGANYHRYPLYAFLLLWSGLEFTRALRHSGAIRWLGIAGLSFGVLILAPFYAHRIIYAPQTMPMARAIQDDLVSLGGTQLQGKVQCMDIVDGCV